MATEDIVDALKRWEIQLDNEGLYTKAQLAWEAYREIEKLRAVGKEWGTKEWSEWQTLEREYGITE
jgi:hypothetical protein